MSYLDAFKTGAEVGLALGNQIVERRKENDAVIKDALMKEEAQKAMLEFQANERAMQERVALFQQEYEVAKDPNHPMYRTEDGKINQELYESRMDQYVAQSQQLSKGVLQSRVDSIMSLSANYPSNPYVQNQSKQFMSQFQNTMDMQHKEAQLKQAVAEEEGRGQRQMVDQSQQNYRAELDATMKQRRIDADFELEERQRGGANYRSRLQYGDRAPGDGTKGQVSEKEKREWWKGLTEAKKMESEGQAGIVDEYLAKFPDPDAQPGGAQGQPAQEGGAQGQPAQEGGAQGQPAQEGGAQGQQEEQPAETAMPEEDEQEALGNQERAMRVMQVAIEAGVPKEELDEYFSDYETTQRLRETRKQSNKLGDKYKKASKRMKAFEKRFYSNSEEQFAAAINHFRKLKEEGFSDEESHSEVISLFGDILPSELGATNFSNFEVPDNVLRNSKTGVPNEKMRYLKKYLAATRGQEKK
jgi:hypothetical protein